MTRNRVVLKSISIEGLFGQARSTRIDLDSGYPTILTGANGSGKSTILRVVSALSNGDLLTLINAPLESLSLQFSESPPLTMQRIRDEPRFSLVWGEKNGVIEASGGMLDLPPWAQAILHDTGYDRRKAFEALIDVAGSQGIPFAEYTVAREILSSENATEAVLGPEWLSDYGESFPVLFVSDQRLVTDRGVNRKRTPHRGDRPSSVRSRESGLAVESAAHDIARQIDRAFSTYGQFSVKLDRRFPQEVIRAVRQGQEVTDSELLGLSTEVERKREALLQVGLLEPAEQGPGIDDLGMSDEVALRPVARVLLASTLEKLGVLDELEQRLSALKQFLDRRFKSKRLVLSRAEGIRFETSSGLRLHPRQLSSGEQQLTVLAYEILFRAAPNTLVIIDEPELSLHVVWQDSLVDDLTRMGNVSQLQFLMATHSPTIIAEHPQLERPLGGRAE